MRVVFIFRRLVGEGIFGFHVEAIRCSIDELHITRINFPGWHLAKVELKDLLDKL